MQDAGDGRSGKRAKPVGVPGVRKAVRVVLRVPDAPVHVGAATGFVSEGLRGERRNQPVPCRHGPDGLPVCDLVVGGTDGRRVPGRELLLAGTQLRVGQLDRQPLGRKGGHDVLDDVFGGVHADAAEAQASIHRLVTVVRPSGEVELVLECGIELEASVTRAGDHASKE